MSRAAQGERDARLPRKAKPQLFARPLGLTDWRAVRFNVSDAGISGESGILVHQVAAEQVQQIADVTFAGSVNFSIPTGANDVHAGCVVQRDYNVFALWPHMHQVATHQKVVLTHGGTPTTLLDSSYSFTEQKYYAQPQVIAIHCYGAPLLMAVVTT